MFAFHVQDCGRPRYEVRNWPLHFLFLLSASLGHEIFYITCLPNIHWSVDPFLCRRLLNMWAVSRSWRECVFVCECVCICQSDCISVHKPPVWCLFPSQCHISSLCFSAFFSLHLSTSFHPCPPPSPVTCLWHHHVHISPGLGVGGTGASLTRTPDMVKGHTWGHISGKVLLGAPLQMCILAESSAWWPWKHVKPQKESRCRHTQTASLFAVCVMGSVFSCPLCPCPECWVDALYLNSVFFGGGVE